MNVQDVIEKALSGNDGIPVTSVEHSSCEDVQVEKLASALNFIGTNLESSVDEIEKIAKDNDRRDKSVGVGALAAGAGTAGVAAHKALGLRKDLAHNLSEQASYAKASLLSPKMQETAYLGGMKEKAKKLKNKRNLYAGGAGLGLLAAGYGAKKLYDSRKSNQQKKTASVDELLYNAAQAGKQSLLEKVAEDRINPAKISAGPAAPYSGEIMPNPGKVSNEFVGNTRDHHALIALKAQKVRDRVNKDMKQYVNNVGDGYNLQGHLNKMNK